MRDPIWTTFTIYWQTVQGAAILGHAEFQSTSSPGPQKSTGDWVLPARGSNRCHFEINLETVFDVILRDCPITTCIITIIIYIYIYICIYVCMYVYASASAPRRRPSPFRAPVAAAKDTGHGPPNLHSNAEFRDECISFRTSESMSEPKSRFSELLRSSSSKPIKRSVCYFVHTNY